MQCGRAPGTGISIVQRSGTSSHPSARAAWAGFLHAAAEIADRAPDPRLEPFRADRFERGELLAASKGPYPWT